MSLKYFEIINEPTSKIHGFILQFYNIKLYVGLLIVYMINEIYLLQC
jgi:hypothetical protein